MAEGLVDKRNEAKLKALTYDITLVRLAEWIAIEHDKTILQFEEYMEQAQELADLLQVIGYRLIGVEVEGR